MLFVAMLPMVSWMTAVWAVAVLYPLLRVGLLYAPAHWLGPPTTYRQRMAQTSQRPVSWSLLPKLTATPEASWVDVTYRGHGAHRQLRLLFRVNKWNRRGLRVSLEPETQGHRIARGRGLQDLETGDPAFDAAFLIRSSDPRIAMRALDRVTMAWIQTMAEALGSGGLTLRLEPLLGEVVKVVGDNPVSEEDLQLFRTGTLAWQEALLAAVAGRDPAGVALPEDWSPSVTAPDTEIVSLEAVTAAGASLCQVCGDTVETDSVVCHHCEVPHHADCWEFHGGCTTYGCRGTPLGGG